MPRRKQLDPGVTSASHLDYLIKEYGGGKERPSGDERRVAICMSVKIGTLNRIDEIAKARNVSRGRIVDEWAAVPKIEGRLR